MNLSDSSLEAAASQKDSAQLNHMTLRLETYDKGDAFDPALFVPIKNLPFVKPQGGLWASPVDCEWGWKDWCKAEKFRPLATRFEFEFNGRAVIIDSVEDLDQMPWTCPFDDTRKIKHPDFEAMVSQGIDAVYLTDNGQHNTRFSTPDLYGWDCECVLVLNPTCITPL